MTSDLEWIYTCSTDTSHPPNVKIIFSQFMNATFKITIWDFPLQQSKYIYASCMSIQPQKETNQVTTTSLSNLNKVTSRIGLHACQVSPINLTFWMQTQQTEQVFEDILSHGRHWLYDRDWQFQSVHSSPQATKNDA